MIIPFSIEKADEQVMSRWESAAQAVQLYSSVILRDAPTPDQIAMAQRAFATDMDLYPLDHILVTVAWNGNDDVFDKGEVWLAKDTPVDKPFNLEHKPRQIIGHITGSKAVDENLHELPSSLAFDEIPDKYHVLNSSVLYKHVASRDESLEREMASLIDEIRNSYWYVSMECLFKSFDYALESDGIQRVVARTQETAYLTKHLRAYGGTGVYQNEKVGRVLRNITFSAVGLVKKPANKESVILTTSSIPSVNINSQITNYEGHTMAEMKDVMVDNLEKQLAAANIEIAALRDRLDKADEAQHKAAIATLEGDVKTRDASIAELNKKVEELTAKANELAKTKETLETEKTALADQVKALSEENNTMKSQAKQTSRVSILVDKGVEKAKAEEIVTKFNNLSDEQFADIVEVHASLVKKPDQTVEPVTEPTSTVASEEVIEKATPDPDPALGAAGEDNKAVKTKELSRTLASLLRGEIEVEDEQ